MATQEQHREDCVRLLGNQFADVHAYLDGLTDIYPTDQMGEYHRRYRHNGHGVRTCLELWGEEAAKAAKIHILRDWYGMPLTNLNLEEALKLADGLLAKITQFQRIQEPERGTDNE